MFGERDLRIVRWSILLAVLRILRGATVEVESCPSKTAGNGPKFSSAEGRFGDLGTRRHHDFGDASSFVVRKILLLESNIVPFH